jgi:adenine deaminase
VWLLEASEGLPLDVFVMAPLCVPASAFESSACRLETADMEAILRHPRALGIAEMMDFPGVIAGDAAVLERLAAAGTTHADGRAPGVSGRRLDAYVAAGIRSEHESDDIRGGAREAPPRHVDPAARGVQRPLPARPAAARGPPRSGALRLLHRHREPDFLWRGGHMDQMCREAVAAGIAPESALLLASLIRPPGTGSRTAGRSPRAGARIWSSSRI